MALDKTHLLMLSVTANAAIEENVQLAQQLEAKNVELAKRDVEIVGLKAEVAKLKTPANAAPEPQPQPVPEAAD